MLKNRSIPFGYCMVNGKYALNAPEADAVQKIFADYIDGKSLKTIAVEMQIPYNISKKIWNMNMVCRVLENVKYLGNGKFPRIVSNEDFENAARIKTERKIKDYLQRNNMTQKQFVIGLIKNEIERDLTQRAAVSEAPTDSERVVEEHAGQQETVAVSDCESFSEEVGELPEEQESTDFSDDFDDESEESENFDEDEDLDENEDQGESEEMGMSMSM